MAENESNAITIDADLRADALGTIEEAIDGLYRIYRLAELAEEQLEDVNLDGRIFLQHAATLCARHGKRLDEIFGRLSPAHTRVCAFDEIEDLGDLESPVGPKARRLGVVVD